MVRKKMYSKPKVDFITDCALRTSEIERLMFKNATPEK